jgi:hypothetical protein
MRIKITSRYGKSLNPRFDFNDIGAITVNFI